MVRLLGIDPGLRFTGWGVLEVDGNRLRHLGDGVIATDSAESVPDRLRVLHDALGQVMDSFRPDEAAVEQTFVNKDATGTLKLGQARGIALLAPAEAGIAVGEYAPNAVKKALVGVGHAQKAQVEHMVRMHLPGVEVAGPDAADALAIAICHAHHLATAGRYQAALARALGGAA
jgi:crossover junction endodeoxyribonuclease RuvC